MEFGEERVPIPLQKQEAEMIEEYQKAEKFSERIVKILPWCLLFFCSGLFAGYAWAMRQFA